MPHTDVIPTSASIASTGLGIRYIGSPNGHIYGYNEAAVTQSETDIFSFTSGSGYIMGALQINYAADQSENALYKIYFNNVRIQSWVVPGGTQSPAPEQPLLLLIPPLTIVLVTGILLSGGSPRTHYGSLTGRVYGAV